MGVRLSFMHFLKKFRYFKNCMLIVQLQIFYFNSLHPQLKATRSSPLFLTKRSSSDRAYQTPSHSMAPFFSFSLCEERIAYWKLVNFCVEKLLFHNSLFTQWKRKKRCHAVWWSLIQSIHRASSIQKQWRASRVLSMRVERWEIKETI